ILSALSSSSAPEFAHENRFHWLCGQASANPVPHAGARASGRSLTQKKESSDFKIEIAAPFILGIN
ncbi:MAG: hypothetical protein UDF26_07905, partial [Clostridia bacterium]|nr:hypothetical protein [Clostridia bacterium]